MEENNIKYIKKPNSKEKRLYFTTLMKNVVMTGIPQIVTERNVKRKILKLFVFFVCLFGFFYQLTSFLLLYFTYPTNMEVSVKYMEKDHLPKPIVTICDMNGIRRRYFCWKFPNECSKPKNITDFCEQYNQFCESGLTDNDLLFPDPSDSDKIVFNRTVVEEFASLKEDLFYFHFNKSIFRRIFYVNELMNVKSCYAIDHNNHFSSNYSFHFPPLDMLKLFISDSKQINNIFLFLHRKEWSWPYVPVGAKVSIHSRDQLVNPFLDGFFIKPGNVYIIQLTPIEKFLLPSPYNTNCIDYEKSANETFDKIVHHDRCLIECKKILTLKKCECIPSDYPFEINGTFCNAINHYECLLSLDEKDCEYKCRKDCRFIIFKYEVQETPIPLLHGISSEDYESMIRKKIAMINLVFKNQELKILKLKPKFQRIELFSYIGGYIGIWLGISLIAIFDLLEVIAIYICHIFKDKIPIIKKE